MKALIDLVVVTYKAHEETKQFFESLSRLDVPFTLTVVDNNDEENSQDVLELYSSIPKCVDSAFLDNPTNVGYARACNQGARVFDSDVVCLLNCDTQFTSGIFPLLRNFYDYPRMGVVGPKMVTSKGDITHGGIFKDQKTRSDVHRQWLAHDHGQCEDFRYAPTVSGAAYFVRRSCWNELTTCPTYRQIAPEATGAFLPTDHYWEETWCSYHARDHGWDVVYDGRTTMIHEWHRSAKVGELRDVELQSRKKFQEACKTHGIDSKGMVKQHDYDRGAIVG